MSRWVLVLVAAAALLVAPAAVNLARNPDWRASPRFDGAAYRLSLDDVVLQERDPTGAAAVLATLERWRDGGGADANGGADAGGGADDAWTEGRERIARLDDFAEAADARGFAGFWLEVAPQDLPRLHVPFVAHVADAGGRLLIVRRVALGHVYASDPTRGQVLVPLPTFLATWTGRAFAFPDPPPQPPTW